MPGLDGTGPMGMGPRTGGGFGFCPPGSGPAPYAYGVRGLGRGGLPWGGGRGFGFGGGRGWRRGYGRARWGAAPYAGYGYGYAPHAYGPGYALAAPAAPTAEQELQFLRAEAEAVRQTLADIEKRIADVETSQQDDA